MQSRSNLPLVLPVALTGLVLTIAACSPDEPASNAITSDPVLARGAEVYARSCASCHGADLRGTDEGPSHLSIVYEPNHHPDDSFRRAIAHGSPQHHWSFGDMPPLEGLSGDDVDAVIAFIRAEQQRHGFER